MRKKILECAKVAFGVALSIGVGYLMLHYAKNPEPAAPYRPPDWDIASGTLEAMPETCTLGQVYMVLDPHKPHEPHEPIRTFTCVATWTEIPITIK